MECGYCGRAAPEGRKHHAECSAERSRRIDAGLCVACGDAKWAFGTGFACGKCYDPFGLKYRGYPGGRT